MNDPQKLVASIGEETVRQLKKENISHLLVTLDERLGLADVQVSLKDRSRECRRKAIQRFATVEEQFEDVVSLLIRFTNDDTIMDASRRSVGDSSPAFAL